MQYYIILKLIFSWGFLAFLGAILTVVGIGKLFPNTLTSELAIYVGLHFFILYSLLLEQVFEKVQFLIIPTWSLAMALLFWTTYAYWGWVYLPYPLFLFYGIYWVAHKKNVKVSVLGDLEIVSFPKKQEILRTIEEGEVQVSGELEKTMLAEAYQKFVLKSHERITHNIKILHQFRENYREHFLQDNYEELLKIMEELIGFVQQESRRSNVFKLNRRAYSLVKELVPEDIL